MDPYPPARHNAVIVIAGTPRDDESIIVAANASGIERLKWLTLEVSQTTPPRLLETSRKKLMLRFPFLATAELSTDLYDVLNCAVPFCVGG